LARYTGNNTYATEAEKMWNWLEASVLIDKSDSTTWKVNDGTGVDVQCANANHAQYSYNYGILIGGLAYMYNHVSACTAQNSAKHNAY
jgi:mannan endo-1,6-alpha-mannosidase